LLTRPKTHADSLDLDPSIRRRFAEQLLLALRSLLPDEHWSDLAINWLSTGQIGLGGSRRKHWSLRPGRSVERAVLSIGASLEYETDYVLRSDADQLQNMLNDPRCAPVRRYLLMVATSAGRTRRRDRTNLLDLNRLPESGPAHSAGEQLELREIVNKYVRSLDDREQQMLRWCVVEGRSPAALARRLGISRRTVDRHLRILLSKLREMYDR
jgi:RNA polymerase sigma factor (sigma-70 family)